MKIAIAAAALALVAGIAAQAWARCPPGTSYQCVPYGNKMMCGCH